MAKSSREREATQRKKTDAAAWLTKQSQGDATGVKLPEGVSWWKPKVGVNRIDVIPFVAGQGNPNADPGYEHWERSYYRHYWPGFDGRSHPYACLGNWKEICPLCQAAQKMDKDAQQSMKGKLQMLLNVVDLDDKEKDKVQVWEAVYYNKKKGFGEQLVTLLRARSKYLNFSDLQKGFTLVLTAEEEQGGRGKYVVVTRIDFEERSHKYPDSFIEKAACLDDCLVKHPAADLRKLAAMEPQDEPDDQPVPGARGADASAARSTREEPGKEEEEEHTEGEVEVGNTVSHPDHDGPLTVVKVNRTRTEVKVKDPSGKEIMLKAAECGPYEESEKNTDDDW